MSIEISYIFKKANFMPHIYGVIHKPILDLIRINKQKRQAPQSLLKERSRIFKELQGFAEETPRN